MKELMQRRMTREQLESDRDMYQKHATLNSFAMQAMHAGDVLLWSPWTREADAEGKYRVGVGWTDRAHGGIAIVVYRNPGQYDSLAAYYLEELESDVKRDVCGGYSRVVSECLNVCRRLDYARKQEAVA